MKLIEEFGYRKRNLEQIVVEKDSGEDEGRQEGDIFKVSIDNIGRYEVGNLEHMKFEIEKKGN
ncbi:hypothetical protein QWY16_10950 [Planococcus shenhongbingii]|uniref:hypothetical protein n=1 Tax=Planococcus shenhongbingii TaxID=3058398 RepID=UPI00262B3E46|nr:hypothetical protein [Planococcus sp. N016]WKA57027.1 hypothetical protein QWY16_10950 [Planococcus sp. N016]